MLSATRADLFGRSYTLNHDGRPLTTLASTAWGSGLRFTLAGHEYEVRAKAFRTRWEVVTNGVVVAVAEGVGRKAWSLDVDGVRYEFRRASMWGNEHSLLAGGRSVGTVRRAGTWQAGAEAHLPADVPLHVQVFALVVALVLWRAVDSSST